MMGCFRVSQLHTHTLFRLEKNMEMPHVFREHGNTFARRSTAIERCAIQGLQTGGQYAGFVEIEHHFL